MKILLTGVTGYIGRRLFDVLIHQGHHVTCLVRNSYRFKHNLEGTEFFKNVEVIEADLFDMDSLLLLPNDFDVAYFLVHALTNKGDFQEKELMMANNFKDYLDQSNIKQCIYLGGIVNDENLSDHLSSRLVTENVLEESKVPLTVFRAGIIIGSGSASFEIIRDLVEKLPVMIAPIWLRTKCQPIAIRNVLEYLSKAALKEGMYNQIYDIGSDEILTYKEMLMGYAEARNLNRYIKTIPVMTPKMSSYWLYFVTSVSYNLAINLVDSMKNDVIVMIGDIDNHIQIEKIPYVESIKLAFDKIEQNAVVSSWSDTISSGVINVDSERYINVPVNAVLTDITEVPFPASNKKEVIERLWNIGGNNGWYGMDWAWRIRGVIDTAVGGVGLRRGRRNANELIAGDALDFWRVVVANKQKGRLLLYAEMKIPGEAWLEFTMERVGEVYIFKQVATFRPLGLFGRLYWYAMYPFHLILFPMMAKRITKI